MRVLLGLVARWRALISTHGRLGIVARPLRTHRARAASGRTPSRPTTGRRAATARRRSGDTSSPAPGCTRDPGGRPPTPSPEGHRMRIGRLRTAPRRPRRRDPRGPAHAHRHDRGVQAVGPSVLPVTVTNSTGKGDAVHLYVLGTNLATGRPGYVNAGRHAWPPWRVPTRRRRLDVPTSPDPPTAARARSTCRAGSRAGIYFCWLPAVLPHARRPVQPAPGARR